MPISQIVQFPFTLPSRPRKRPTATASKTALRGREARTGQTTPQATAPKRSASLMGSLWRSVRVCHPTEAGRQSHRPTEPPEALPIGSASSYIPLSQEGKAPKSPIFAHCTKCTINTRKKRVIPVKT